MSTNSANASGEGDGQASRLTVSQFFVRKRPIAWVALLATLLWGVYAYLAMPQRQDPVIPVRTGAVVSFYPGADAKKVELELTRKIERKLAESPSVENIHSLSSQGLSIVYVELSEHEKNAESVWQDLRGKLDSLTDLPTIGEYRIKPYLDKDFGETVAVMLTVASPKVSDLEISLRAGSIREAIAAARQTLAAADARSNRHSGVLVYPSSFARSAVVRLGRSLLRALEEADMIRDGRIVEAPGAICIDFELLRSRPDLERAVARWQTENLAAGESHPDVWAGVIVKDLAELPGALRLAARDKYTYRELREFADRIQDKLKRMPTIGKVEQIGAQQEQVTLYYSDERFAQFDLRPQDVLDRLRARNTNLPGGRVELPSLNIVVRPTGELTPGTDLGGVVMDLSADGYPFYLRDMVDITRGYADPPGVMCFRTRKSDVPNDATTQPAAIQTTRAITLAIRQVKGTHIADFDRDLQSALDAAAPSLPDDLAIERTSDEPAEVRQKIRDFDRNLIEALLIVVAVAVIFMEWRSAILVAVAIPVTVAMTLGICQLIGVDLQQVSIASLIIALGLLVDDPVVAADAINRELAAGVKRNRAAWLGPQKLARAILFATLTNIVAFLPLLLVEGKVGDFIWSLPVVVTASLVSSRIVSMTFMPLLGYYVLRGQKGLEAQLGTGRRKRNFAYYYNGFTEWTLNHKAISLTVCIVVLAGCCAAAPLIGSAFFPRDLHSTFSVNVYLPEGSPIRQTREETFRTIHAIEQVAGKDVGSYTSFVGAGGPRFWLSVVPEPRADAYAQILVHTRDESATPDIVERLKRELPRLSSRARITIEQLETGPPVGVPIQVRVFGPDDETLRQLAEQIKAKLRSIPGTDNIHDDWDPKVFQIGLQIDPDRANITGITNADVAAVVNAGLSGHTATAIRDDDRLIPVNVRLRPEERSSVADISSLSAISGLNGSRVPVRQIGSWDSRMVCPNIRRRQHERCITVKADTVAGVLPSAVVRVLDRQLQQGRLPPGYRYEFGGEEYEQRKGFAAVRKALIVSLVAIYLVLVWQFNSVTKPLIVFAAVPFGIAGGLMGLLFFGAPFGFMAFLGVASLAGVIVSHIIVLFDYIEEMRERGEPLHRAVIDAALVRLRPVLVTVLATVGGLVPLAFEGGPLWRPMCYVLIVGLLAATLVTKVIVPVLYVLFVENLRLIRWETPARAEMAMAADR